MNVLKRDDSGLQGQYVGLAPIAVETILADTSISHIAITVQDVTNVYFTSNPSAKFSVPAQTTILVNTGMRIDSNTICLVY